MGIERVLYYWMDLEAHTRIHVRAHGTCLYGIPVRRRAGPAGRKKKKNSDSDLALDGLQCNRHPSLSGATEGGERRRGKMRD